MKTLIQKLLETTRDLSNLSLEGVNFAGMNLTEAKFSGSNLTGANFEGAELSFAEFIGANLRAAKFERSNLFGANFEGANLEDTHFDYARLVHASFKNCNIHEACLQQANLTNACVYENFIQVGPIVRRNYVTYFIDRDVITSPWFKGSLEYLKDYLTEEEEDFASHDKEMYEGFIRAIKILEACKRMQ